MKNSEKLTPSDMVFSAELYKETLVQMLRIYSNHIVGMIKSSIYYSMHIPVNLWELLAGDLPPTNSSKEEILCVTFKCTKLYLVVAYM
jgi:hypothetical protein